jgi:hypothetical protein
MLGRSTVLEQLAGFVPPGFKGGFNGGGVSHSMPFEKTTENSNQGLCPLRQAFVWVG